MVCFRMVLAFAENKQSSMSPRSASISPSMSSKFTRLVPGGRVVVTRALRRRDVLSLFSSLSPWLQSMKHGDGFVVAAAIM